MHKIVVPDYNLYLERVINKIETSLDDDLSIEQLASVAGYSPFHFQRLFKDYLGENVASYIKRLRIEKSAFMLKYQYKKISTVAMRIGFNSNTSFTRAFKSYYNMSPLEFKDQYKYFYNDEDTPAFTIINLDDFKIFFVRTFGSYFDSEPLAWNKLSNCFNRALDENSQYISICYDEPTIIKSCSKLRYEACILYEEKKHSKIKNLVLKNVEGGKYAKFEFQGTLREFDLFFYKVYHTFFHNKDYQISLKPAIQIHHNNANSLLHGITRTDLLIPID